ncbi:MAG: tetratricopeptide repeat-containing sensor histidine kinase [Ardenticatenaceae bacterium]|nr:tetratricopeptide repeat-containing sensor histidine kinase [Ardenticatenaceae bacterium]
MNQTTAKLQQAVAQAQSAEESTSALIKLAEHYRTFDLAQALQTAEKAQQIAQNQPVSPQNQLTILTTLGKIHTDSRSYEAGIQVLQQALAKADALQDRVMQAQILSNIGFIFLEWGSFTESLSYFLKSLTLARQTNSVRVEISALNGIGNIYGESGNNQEAINHLEQALTLERQLDSLGEEVALNNCAFHYARMGDFARALDYGQQCLKLSEARNDPLGAIFARNRIGEAYMGLGEYAQAQAYFQQNLDYLRPYNLKPRRLHTLYNLGKLQLANQQPQAAIQYLEDALEIALGSHGKQYIYEVHELLAIAYKSLNNLDMALHHFEHFHATKEAVFNEKSRNARRGLEIAYRTESAQREALILQQKNAELEREVEERKRAEAEARQASQAKSRFLATMSHELRTPLNSIIGFAELIELELREQQNLPLAEDVHRIHRNGLHLLELVNDVLDMAKIETGKLVIYPEKVSPWLIVQEVAEAVAHLTKEGVAFQATADPNLPDFVVDTVRIKQILFNLLSNAFKFTESGWVKLTAVATPAAIQFIVEDNGIGIPADQMPILFETFAQIDIPQNRTLRGTGLGLPISRDLARLHGGFISVESAVGQGSKFTVTLPRNLHEGASSHE